MKVYSKNRVYLSDVPNPACSANSEEGGCMAPAVGVLVSDGISGDTAYPERNEMCRAHLDEWFGTDGAVEAPLSDGWDEVGPRTLVIREH